MADLTVIGGNTAAGDACEIHIRDGIFGDRDDAAPVFDAAGAYVLPGWLDLQVNGAAGFDLTESPDELWTVASALAQYGVTAFAPTVVTSSPGERDRILKVLRNGPPDGWTGAIPVGAHFEGPMLAPSRRGAHTESRLRTPSVELTSDWSRENGVAIVTLAPELPGAIEVIEGLVSRGVVVSLGHTATGSGPVRLAAAAGARMVTHLGNAMPSLLARDPGLMGIALGGDDLVAGVIADGVHLDPDVLRLFWRALAPERLLLVTDTTAALGMPDGPLRLGEQYATVADGAVRLADGTLAGSAASISQCLSTLIATVGCSLEAAVACCTSTPADLISDRSRGRIQPGARGDLTLVDDDLRVIATIVGGRVIYSREN